MRAILITAADRGTRMGSVQFVFSAQFQATFKGYWSDLVLVGSPSRS